MDCSQLFQTIAPKYSFAWHPNQNCKPSTLHSLSLFLLYFFPWHLWPSNIFIVVFSPKEWKNYFFCFSFYQWITFRQHLAHSRPWIHFLCGWNKWISLYYYTWFTCLHSTRLYASWEASATTCLFLQYLAHMVVLHLFNL